MSEDDLRAERDKLAKRLKKLEGEVRRLGGAGGGHSMLQARRSELAYCQERLTEVEKKLEES